MQTIYVVYCTSYDGMTYDGPVSVWGNYDDAEAAAGEAAAMDYEISYRVEEIVGDAAISDFWFHNPHCV